MIRPGYRHSCSVETSWETSTSKIKKERVGKNKMQLTDLRP
jgi:hypothetical protein